MKYRKHLTLLPITQNSTPFLSISPFSPNMGGLSSSDMAIKKSAPPSLPHLPPSSTSSNYPLEVEKILLVTSLIYSELKKIVQGKLQLNVLKRRNFLYIIWNKKEYSDLRLYSMVDFVHYQLMSSLTAKIDKILDENQTYDPAINFGKGKSVSNLLQFAVENGLNSLPTLFNAIPIAFMTNQVRTLINSAINIK